MSQTQLQLISSVSSSHVNHTSLKGATPANARLQYVHMAPSLARLTILLFGLSSFAAGLYSLLRPLQSLDSLGLPRSALPAANGNALAAVAMGVYYNLAAFQDNRAFYLATVPMRLTTTVVFWRQDWKGVACWEGGCAVATLLALFWDARQEKRKTM
ncbi:hypothetical protein CkaCkLH20_00705 [Colletotrichum karsti]|uniref:Uncharacterized protein n=1 Tax=Colletotrichum karsti TaxID=1095194 RepID=A0A9P6IFN4_9PEZI|nr:uncharacterized protein CkaCkLH20_00705 [Colletotrichum karsti]KAF9881559.1 hypothetical protein CkaCkLH20_00705 [Colletotrichum karsti]